MSEKKPNNCMCGGKAVIKSVGSYGDNCHVVCTVCEIRTRGVKLNQEGDTRELLRVWHTNETMGNGDYVQMGYREQIKKLTIKIAEKSREIESLLLKNQIETSKRRKAETSLEPVKSALNAMTAERGKWKKKLKKAGLIKG